MSSHISEKALNQIKKNKIQPTSRWKFVLKNILFWCVFILSILFGARVFGSMLFIFASIDIDFFFGSFQKFSNFFIHIFPFVWFSAFLLFILLAVFGLHKTSGGYRVSIRKLVLVNLLCTVFLGIILFYIGDGKRFEDSARIIPFYSGIEERREKFWGRPEEGRLVGKVLEAEEGFIVLEDPRMQKWHVYHDDGSTFSGGEHVRIVGDVIDYGEFEAEEIFLWEPRKRPPKPPKRAPAENELENSERNTPRMRMNEWRGQSIHN
jgi:hypothetical protein